MQNKTLEEVEFTPNGDGSTFNTIGASDHIVTIFTWVLIVGLCQVIDIFGVVTNIINIKCFIKQGFKEPVNISLFGLAISDLGCLVTQICINIGYTFIVGGENLNFETLGIIYLVAGIPHFSFSRVNSWITAIITLERCLCITVPLKMKNIVTPKRVWILTSCVFVIFIFSGFPVYAVNKIDMKFSPAKNRTLLGLVATADKDKVEGITFAINSFFLPFVAFITIIICTIILVVNLRKKTKWRKSVTQTDLSSREQKVAKMVVMVSALFIFCFFPLSVHMLAVSFEPELLFGGKYENITQIITNIGLLLESINSSANIFIYYHMSRKYRDTFRLMLHINDDKSNSRY